MAVTAEQVNQLRKKTGAGMMDCKKALVEANGDMEKAIEILRKKGAAVAAKRAERSANEGLVVIEISEDKSNGTILESNCETDFVANSSDFVNLANSVLKAAHTKKPASVNELVDTNSDIKNLMNDVLGKVGEKIEISRFVNEKANNGIVVGYTHLGSKLGVLARFDEVGKVKDEFDTISKDIAMQIAAMNPICVYREEVPKETVEKEIDIYKELAKKEGKPEQILDKIATGRLNKFYQENVLVEQAFIKDNSKTVGDLLKEFNTKNGTNIKIAIFHRYHLGDEKK
jgi:elongation factor Ts